MLPILSTEAMTELYIIATSMVTYSNFRRFQAKDKAGLIGSDQTIRFLESRLESSTWMSSINLKKCPGPSAI